MSYILSSDRYVVDEDWDGNQEALITLTRTVSSDPETVSVSLGGTASYQTYYETHVQVHSSEGSLTIDAPPGFDSAEGVLRHPDGSQFVVFYSYTSDPLSTDYGYRYALTKVTLDGNIDTGFGESGTWYAPASAEGMNPGDHRFILDETGAAIVVQDENSLAAFSAADGGSVTMPGLLNPEHGTMLFLNDTLSIRHDSGNLKGYSHESDTPLWTIATSFNGGGSPTNARDSFSWNHSLDLVVRDGVAYVAGSSVDGSTSTVDSIQLDTGAIRSSIDGVFTDSGIVVASSGGELSAQAFNSTTGEWETLALEVDSGSLSALPTDAIVASAGNSIYFLDPTGIGTELLGVYKVDVAADGTLSLDTGFGQAGHAIWPDSTNMYAKIVQSIEVGLQASEPRSDYDISGASVSGPGSDPAVYVDFAAGETEASFVLSVRAADRVVDDQETVDLLVVDGAGEALSDPISLSITDDGQNNLGSKTFDLHVGEPGVTDRTSSPYEEAWRSFDSSIGEEVVRLSRMHNWNVDTTYETVDKIQFTFEAVAGADAAIAGGLDFAFGWHGHEYKVSDGSPVRIFKNPDITQQFAMGGDGTDHFVFGVGDGGEAPYYFGAMFDGEYHLMSVQQSQVSGDVTFDLAAVDGSGMSGHFVASLVRDLGLDYSDHVLAGADEHYQEVSGSVDLMVGGNWISASEPASAVENEFVFIYDNVPYEAYMALHTGALVEVLFGNNEHFGDLNDDVEVNPDLFTVIVNGSESTHTVVDVIIDNTVLLVLDNDIAAGSDVAIEYIDPMGVQFGNVLETYGGVDTASTESPLISQSMDTLGFGSSTFNVRIGDGATLGWNSMLEEDLYTGSADWHDLAFAVISADQASDRMTLEINPTGWINNPHYDVSDSSGVTSQPFLSLKVSATLSYDAAAIDGTATDLLDLINVQNQDLLVHEWNISALTSDGLDGASPQEHHLVTYELANGGAPAILALASGFGFGNTIFGSDYSDSIGSPLALTSSVVNAGHGDDYILNGVFADTYANGGLGDDTLVIFRGIESDFTISPTGSNTFTMSALDGSVTSYLTSIEYVQFEDGSVHDLGSVDPVGGFSVTTLGGSGTETASLFNGYDYADLTSVTSGLDAYFVLDLGVPDGIDELSTLGADKTGSYGLSGFEGFIVAGSAISQLGTDTQIDIFTSPDANDSVVIAEGSGLSIDLGVESTWDILSFRGTDAAVDITLTDKTSYTTFEAFGGNSEVLGADAVLGSESNDSITGYASSTNALAGSAGDDTITGGNEADALYGGDGDDTLIGGAGDDILIDLDGNTTGSLVGGDGRDLYWVRGDETSAAHISGFGVAQDGLARGSLSSDLYNDRIAFNISSSALATIAALSQADTVNWPPSPTATEIAEYLQLRDLISLDVTNASGDGQNWELTATVNHLDADGVQASTLLGRATFSTDTAYTIDADGVGSTLKTKVLEWDDGTDSFLDSIAQAVLDHAEFNDHALSITAGTQGGTDGFTTETVDLVVGIYADDAQRVELQDGAPPILLPVIVNGQEVAARFQPVDADEKIVGGRAGDSYEFVSSTFIDDATDQPLADQSFGTDLVIERGLRGDTTQRDKLEFAEYTDPGNTEVGSGLSINDLLVGDLLLTRTEIGSEGAGRSLEVTYSGTELNHVDVGLYKQYYEYNDSFRVEDLQLLDGDAVDSLVRQYDLGVTDTDGNLSTTDGRDAVLVGRTGVVDTMTVTQGTSSETSIDIILDDFEVTDKLDLSDFGDIANAGADITFGADSVSVTMDLANAVPEDDVTLNFYFTGATPVDETEFLILTASS